jgi:hypothetical protein
VFTRAQESSKTVADVKTDGTSRRLTVEATGDPWFGRVTSKIRLKGRWLKRAGFKPSDRVEVIVESQGTLTIRLIEPVEESIHETPWTASVAPYQLTLWR